MIVLLVRDIYKFLRVRFSLIFYSIVVLNFSDIFVSYRWFECGLKIIEELVIKFFGIVIWVMCCYGGFCFR